MPANPSDALGEDAPPSVRLIAMREAVREVKDEDDYPLSDHMAEWTRVLADILELAAVQYAAYEDALSEGASPAEIDEFERETWRNYAESQTGEDPGEPAPADLFEGLLLNAVHPETRGRYRHNDRYVERLLKELDYHRQTE